jgi:hypothetical protein
MTYYEELGISADAAEEDIRQAHRRLVKLLHPDQQTNDDLRRMAELQLTRVNSLVEQLLDPTQRRIYDLSIRAPLPQPVPASVPRDVSNETIQQGWRYAVAGVAIALIAWIFTSASPTDVVRSVTAGVMPGSVSAAAAPAQGADKSKASPKAPLKPMPAPQIAPRPSFAMGKPLDRERAGNEIKSAEAVVPATATPPPVASAAPVNHPDPSLSPSTSLDGRSVARAAPSSTTEQPGLSGVWLYAGGKSTGGEDEKLYRPEYIELRISEDPAGALYGEYRSRYAVTDLPISPAVNFTFHGNPAAGAELPWKGPKGSSGTVVLKLLHRNAMRVDWKVSQAGDSGVGLEFGTAILVRRL